MAKQRIHRYSSTQYERASQILGLFGIVFVVGAAIVSFKAFEMKN